MTTTKKIISAIALSAIFFSYSVTHCTAQSLDQMMPRIVEKDGRHSFIVDGKPFFVLGGQAHNSSGWSASLPNVWSAVSKLNANTLEVPIYWEQVEPQQGKFDFSLIDILLIQARSHKVRLILLWFATWKNGSNHYMPSWTKTDTGKYPNITGKTGKPIDSPSPHSTATLEADLKAFSAVMTYLKKADAKQHTVIMVQIENEPGAWDSVRDYSANAQKIFEGPVPAELLKPVVLTALNVPVTAKGNWTEVFGNNADEYFHAWSVAAFIGKLAAAGKTIYPLPLYVNAALRDPLTNPSANTYESGGPTDNVIPIWKAAAPMIDLVAPDIYLSGSDKILKVIELYGRSDNALFVPEAAFSPEKVKYLYQVIADGGIGYSPFGIDDNGRDLTDAQMNERLSPFGQEYAMVASMMNQLTAWSQDGKIKAVIEREDHGEQVISLGAWEAVVSFGGAGRGNKAPLNTEPTGKAMIVKLDENKFMLIGTLCHFTFRPTGSNQGKAWQYLSVKEGKFEKGTFKFLRVLNGDETDWGGPRLGTKPTVLEATLLLR